MAPRSRPYRSIAGNATAVLAQAGPTVLNSGEIANKSTTDVWLQLYDAAAAGDVTVGTTTPKHSVFCSLGDGTNYSLRDFYFDDGMEFSLGLVWAVTKELDAGATNPTSNCAVHFRLS